MFDHQDLQGCLLLSIQSRKLQHNIGEFVEKWTSKEEHV